jgi:fatty acid desaturase
MMGFILSGMFGAQHHAAHGALWPDRWLNDVFGRILSGLLLFSFGYFRVFHHRHHRFVGTAADPETHPPIRNFREYFATLATANFLVGLMPPTIRLAVTGRGPDWLTGAAKRRARRDAVMVCGWAVAITGAAVAVPVTVLSWYGVPLLAAALWDAVLSLPEHHGLERTESRADLSRSMAAPGCFKYLQWNENYHREHHQKPSALAHEMPALHARLGRPHDTRYAAFHIRLIGSLG